MCQRFHGTEEMQLLHELILIDFFLHSRVAKTSSNILARGPYSSYTSGSRAFLNFRDFKASFIRILWFQSVHIWISRFFMLVHWNVVISFRVEFFGYLESSSVSFEFLKYDHISQTFITWSAKNWGNSSHEHGKRAEEPIHFSCAVLLSSLTQQRIIA